MATNTYIALDKVTTSGSSTTSITFSSISSAYTDLFIVCSAANTTTSTNMLVRFNSDSGTNYSQTTISGTGTSVGSNRYSSMSAIYVIERHEMTSASNTYSTSNINVQNYSNTTTYKTILSRSGTVNSGAAGTDATVGLWRSTSAITSVTILVNAGAFAAGSTFSLYGIKAQPVASAKATGGTITYAADGYTYHTFTSSGTFTPTQTLTAQILMVAGGGSGGNSYGGGGGAGGVVYDSRSIASSTACTVTIGAGGSGVSTSVVGNDGSSTSFTGSTTAVGGGGGGGRRWWLCKVTTTNKTPLFAKEKMG